MVSLSSSPLPRAFSHRVRPLVGLLAFVTACGGGGGGNNGGITPPPGGGGGGAGAFTIAASATSLSVAQGANGSLTVTVARSGSFTGAVDLTISGLPTGVTGSLQPAQIAAGQTTSTVSLTVVATTAAATTSFTIQATGSGVTNQTVSVQLTVTAVSQQGVFSLSVSAPTYLAIANPAFASPLSLPVLTINRNAGFTGSVSFTVSGLPALLVLGVPGTTGNTAPILILNAGVPNGTYTATIRGTATGATDQTVTMQIVVASPTTGTLVWRFCQAVIRLPWYFAVKDGSGPWTRIVPSATGSTFSFNLTQAVASIAMVTLDSGVARTTVYQYTAQEIAAAAQSECTLYPDVTTRTVTGQVTGLAAGEMSLIGMGWWFGSTTNPLGGTTSSYGLQNLPAGPLDLLAIRASLNVPAQVISNRGILRRGVNPPSGGANALIDFNSTESFALPTAIWTFGNTNGESFGVSQEFTTVGGSTGLFHAFPQPEQTATQRTLYSIPAAQTMAGDLHQVIATIGTTAPARPSRQIITYSRGLIDRSINFGQNLPAPNVSSVSAGGAGLIRAQGNLVTEYNAGVAVDVKSTGPTARFATVLTTRGFLGAGSSYDVQMPNLMSTIGWDNNWNIRPGTPTNWWVSGGGAIYDFFDGRFILGITRVRWAGALTGISAPVDGSTYIIGRASGTITP